MVWQSLISKWNGAFCHKAKGQGLPRARCQALSLEKLEDRTTPVSFLRFVDPNPSLGNGFGSIILPLSSGNVVVTSPFDDRMATNAGAVYLYNGSTGELISTLTGSSANNQIGSGGVTGLDNGNYLICSPSWDSNSAFNLGAVSFGKGKSGISGIVSSANSLIGSTANDQVGSQGVTLLNNGNFVVNSPNWTANGMVNAGAVTWGNGDTGITGMISTTNSLIGSTAKDQVGSKGVIALTNGNFVVASPNWTNGVIVNAGAVTLGNGLVGISGIVSGVNSLVGSTAMDQVGNSGVTSLKNGNYLVLSSVWTNGSVVNAGAVTWGNGESGIKGSVHSTNSLVGSTDNDQVGLNGVTALENGNYGLPQRFCYNKQLTTAASLAGGKGAWMVVDILHLMCVFVQLWRSGTECLFRKLQQLSASIEQPFIAG